MTKRVRKQREEAGVPPPRKPREETRVARPRRRKSSGALVVLAVAAAIAVTVVVQRSGSRGGTKLGASAPIPNPDTSGMEAPVAEILAEARGRVVASPESGEAWGYFAAVLDAHDLFRHAEVAYRRSLELAPDDQKSIYNLAMVLQSLGTDRSEALELFRAFAARQPQFPPVHVRIGIVLSEEGDMQGAAQAYRKALELDPNLTIARRSLAQVLLALDDARGAVEQLELGAKAAPEDGPMQAALSQAYARLGDEAKAAAAAARARGRGETLSLPDPARFLVAQLGRSERLAMARVKGRFADGDYAGAVEDLKIALRTRPASPHVHEQLAAAYDRLGQKALAEQHRAEAKRLRGDH